MNNRQKIARKMLFIEKVIKNSAIDCDKDCTSMKEPFDVLKLTYGDFFWVCKSLDGWTES